jgi:ubiquinone/menaquinone biosynthesis C-methylase UbiE
MLERLLKFFFDFLYHRGSWTYDFVAASVSLGRWKDWVASVLTYISGERVLELGHGPGHLIIALNNIGISAYGLDESVEMGRLASTNLHKRGLPQRLVTGLAQQLPFPGEIFQQVISTFPTQYIISPETLAEVYRLLEPGGSLIVLPVAWITGKAWYDRFAAGLFRITGQAPEWDARFLEPFIEAGFQVQIQYRFANSSKILILLALKPQNV